jgi:hypothetical protein
MNVFAGLLLLAAIICAAVGLAYLYIADSVGADTLWKCAFWFFLLFAASFLPWGAIVGGPTITRRGPGE